MAETKSLAMGLFHSRCYKNKTRYFCSDFTKDGARKHLVLFLIKLS